MPLTGELSDLSLAELIEFFCNQRKTGRLKVTYSIGPGYFYLQNGSVVHARIGVLRGIEAVYYALTLPNASFNFSPAFEPPEHSINQPWTSVVLEGLRRLDEGIMPRSPFPDGDHHLIEESKAPSEKVADHKTRAKSQSREAGKVPPESAGFPVKDMAFLSQTTNSASWTSRPWMLGAVIAAVVLIVGVIGVPWGLYARNKAAKAANQTAAPVENPSTDATAASNQPSESQPEVTSPPAAGDTSELAARRLKEARAKEKARAQEVQSARTSRPVSDSSAKNNSSLATGSRKVTVTVTYDENGRVTQASGGDPTALRIARQKRFPAGKAGSATVTIPIN